MESTFFLISLIVTGISLTLGVLFIIFGSSQKDDREYLVFGFLCLLLTIFFLAPPTGFIVQDKAPYSLDIQVKRIFIFGYYGLIPLFIVYYTRYVRAWFAYFVIALTSVGYLLMGVTQTDSRTPFWFGIALLIFFSVLAFGLFAGIWQLKHGNRKDARYLLSAMSVYAIGLIFTFAHQFVGTYDAASGAPKFFYPFHLHSVLFMGILCLRLVTKAHKRFKSEKVLRSRVVRWDEFLQKAPLIVVELDKQANISHINGYGLNLLGYTSEEELKGKNWFEYFIPEPQQKPYRKVFNDMLTAKLGNPFHRSDVRTRNGEKLVINWIFHLFDHNETEPKSLLCAGRDITEVVKQNEQIKKLQLEVEKENIMVPDLNDLDRTEFIGKGPETEYLLGKIKLVAGTLVPILILGETGVGKEMIADIIQKNSLRHDKPYIKINCGGLPRELIEDEFFGHEKGAFTSAVQARKGRFELADGGTIFLDEIGELPLELQPKLLRVLQDGQFERIGGQKTIKVDVRILAATNRNLEAEVEEGRFRADLFYRLNVFPITIPPLRNRKDDLKDLINYFITRKSKKHGKQVLHISKADVQRLEEYPWPGNVRELKNILERSVLTSQGQTLKLDESFGGGRTSKTSEINQVKSLQKLEEEHIRATLEACAWKINGEYGAAEKLEMHPNTLRSRMKKLGISRPSKG